MKKIVLGRTGIAVTELCFGALPIGPIQKNVPVDTAINVIARALEKGVNFIDTAQGYKTYPHILGAIQKTGIRPVITSKAPAADYEGMEAAINEALNGLEAEYIDIFLLHAARAGADIFDTRKGAYKCLYDYREKGKLKAIGVSAHDVQVVEAAAKEKEIDVVFPILNMSGMGILGGTRETMEAAIESCFENKKGIYIMKALGGGNMVNDYDKAMSYVRNFSKERAPIAVGMVNEKEVDMNVSYFKGEDMTNILSELKVPKKEFIVLKGICKVCGLCAEACHSDAIHMDDAVAFIDNTKCLTCGYCVGACPQFAIRMV